MVNHRAGGKASRDMQQPDYSFIEIAALEAVRRRFVAGEPLVVLSENLSTILWTNGSGAALFGDFDVVSIVGQESGLTDQARRQIIGAPGFHASSSRASQALVRIRGKAHMTAVSRMRLPDGEPGILLSLVGASSGRSAAETAGLAISGFTEPDQHVAIVDHEARVLAASSGFNGLSIPHQTLAELIAQVRTEPDRQVKRLAKAGRQDLPMGIVRLSDDPSIHLLIVVDDGSDDEEPAGVPPAEASVPNPVPRNEPVASRGPVAPAAGERRAVRFLWRTDENGKINAISDEFLDAVNATPDLFTGKSFRELASELGFDHDGVIAGLLERRDTWSGRSVLWPIDGGMSIPVDLAALPAYGRDRNFEGFRGFGVARFGDAAPTQHRPNPIAVEEEPVQASTDMPVKEPEQQAGADATTGSPDHDFPDFMGEKPVLSGAPQAPPQGDKVIKLAERRQPSRDRQLSPVERHAFREIGQKLRGDTQTADDPVIFGRRTETVPAKDDELSIEDAASEDAATPETGTFTPPTPLQSAWEEAAQRDQDLPEPSDGQEPAAGAAVNVAPVQPEPPVLALSAASEIGILSRLPVPVLIHAGDDLHYANPEFLRLTGYRSLESLTDAGGLDALFSDPIEGGVDNGERQLHLRRKDGVEFPIDALLRSVQWSAGTALMLVVRRAGDGEADSETPELAEVRTRNAELRTILDTATDGVVMIDADGTIRSLSRPAEALFGFDSDELAGKPFTSLFAIESQRVAGDYLASMDDHGVASVLNDGREVIGREAQGRFIPLFMTIGRMPNNSGFCAVLRDVTQWKRAEEELSQSRSQAERASSQKSDFLARVSHEIRTPLNAIIGFSELMIDEKFGPIGNDRYRDYLRDINRSGNHVLDLVNDLLDISKIEAGEQDLSYEALSLNDALAEAVAMMQPQANRERVIIRSSFATRLPQVVADQRSVRQIALNVLSNAVRYTQAGGQVIISTAHELNGDIVMRVRDTGIGMSQAEIEQAMKPFKQINALKRARGDGTGLGLPLTKAMVEANRARFSITSAPGEGTLVEIAFPSTRVLVQ